MKRQLDELVAAGEDQWEVMATEMENIRDALNALKRYWGNLRTSFWFVPLLIVAFSVALVLCGIQGAAVLNAVVTLAKIVPLTLFIGLVALAFQVETFRLDFGWPR